ncbi:hypothetical protein BJ322DRAFT_731459 [Thelephora terrestris]|uniref:Uncharacterized protein n=1 Tax=Thelephora terrestris TaxID=56493 RepID=A0A9P6H3R8_9AGAM|nr:hypothetical protein BJ322DRAFT_731459 [Thelephora terrestris]
MQKTRDICLTVPLRTVKMKRPPNPQPTPRLIHSTCLGRTRLFARATRSASKKGRWSTIPDMAFVTVSDVPVHGCDRVRAVRIGTESQISKRRNCQPSEDKVPRPSPKSIYRLADKYDVPALRTLALNQIRGELSKCDIVEESFSDSRPSEQDTLFTLSTC